MSESSECLRIRKSWDGPTARSGVESVDAGSKIYGNTSSGDPALHQHLPPRILEYRFPPFLPELIQGLYKLGVRIVRHELVFPLLHSCLPNCASLLHSKRGAFLAPPHAWPPASQAARVRETSSSCPSGSNRRVMAVATSRFSNGIPYRRQGDTSVHTGQHESPSLRSAADLDLWEAWRRVGRRPLP